MKKIIVFSLILSLLLHNCVYAAENKYLTNEKHTAYVNGYPDGTIRPDSYVTRGETATIVSKLLKSEVEKTDEIIKYNDVSEKDWYYSAISAVVRCGLMKGREEGFSPEKFITRAEFAVICSRMYDEEIMPNNSFSDISGHWAEKEIKKIAELGLIKGYAGNLYKPEEFITRAELITVINKMLGRIPESTTDLYADMNKWSDNLDVGKWYYLAIQEATNSHNYKIKENGFEKWIPDENNQWTKPIK